ncbi:MAG: methionyl-tRNA formyltransferase [bacterium]
MKPFKVVFMGTSDFAVPALKALQADSVPLLSVVTQPDRPAGRGLSLKASPVKRAALEMGLSVFQPEKIKTPEAVEFLENLKPDVIIVAAYGQILPSAVLQIPTVACLNIHGSLLPKYRGAAPIHYAILNGEVESGVTLIYMNEKMDEGDILLSEKMAIGSTENTGQLHDRMAELGAQSLLRALDLLAQSKAARTPQEAEKATYAPSLKREQCKIQWNADASRVVNQVRGLSPWPGAETQWNGKPLKVFSAQVESNEGSAETPGMVLSVQKEGITVAALKGRILLKEVQPPGKRRMSAHDFTLGHPDFKIGEKLT